MIKVLYISMTGMTEPLGESQVVQYLLELAKQHRIFLLSFERRGDEAKHLQIAQKLKAANIEWKFFFYSNRYGVFSTIWQIILAVLMLSKWLKQEQIQLIHARSLVPAVIGMLSKKLLGTKLLFDIRGFAIDEKIMDGRLKENSMLTRVLKKLETKVFQRADHIVTLTHISKPIIQEKYQVFPKNITVIPTCANLALFKPLSKQERIRLKKGLGYSTEDLIILHNGSINGWVDFEAELKLFEQLAFIHSNCKFIFLNNGQHNLIRQHIQNYQIKEDTCKILSVSFDQVHQYLNIADMCIFFIKPSFAKQASAPTKFAEIVACHLYSATNNNYGDMEFYLNTYPVGTLLNLSEVHQTPLQSAKKIIDFIECHRNDITDNFEKLFNEHFSTNIAVQRYTNIYKALSSTTYF